MPIPLLISIVQGMGTTDQPSGYPKNWNDISAAFRKERGYKCAVCDVDCSAHPYLTDAHHLNGDKNDCRYENLQCLCKYHHAKQEFHSHYKVKESDFQVLKKLWSDQKITP